MLRQLIEKHTHVVDDIFVCSNFEIRISITIIRKQNYQLKNFDIDSTFFF